ncbi:maltoporin [Derxia gummosa]|uniref:Maltoporin n=1 Tax=Derxia gummosa DSM 723 TaxID=1121388 RepID=A0A8B6X646_9BURK|nr:carbohydrate porin [Derxia gummosa]
MKIFRIRQLPIVTAIAGLGAFAAAPAAAEDAPVPFQFKGYARSGFATANKGGDQVCFGLAGVSKYRFGNECGTYGEFEMLANIFEVKDGPRFVYDIMFGYYNDGSQNNGSVSGAQPIGWDLRQNWVGVTGVGEGAIKTATFWVGRRYYQRHDVHINDFFYIGSRGQGAGMENLDIGTGKLSLAVLRSQQSASSFDPTTSPTGTTFDARWSKIPVNTDGVLEIAADLRSQDKSDATPEAARIKNGWSLTLEHTQSQVLGGANKFVVQYGKDAGANLNTGDPGAYGFVPATAAGWRAWRVIDNLVAQPVTELAINGVALYQKDDNFNGISGASRTWSSIGVRPVYQWAQYAASAVELGFDRVKLDGTGSTADGKTAQLTKLTVAPIVLRPGPGFFKRPELRVFATFAKWNDAANTLGGARGLTGTSAYATSTSGTTVGAQFETWF